MFKFLNIFMQDEYFYVYIPFLQSGTVQCADGWMK